MNGFETIYLRCCWFMMSDDFTVNFWHFFRREKIFKNCWAPPPRSKNYMHIFVSYTIRTFEKIPSSEKCSHDIYIFVIHIFGFIVTQISYLLIWIKVRQMKIKSFTGVHLTSFLFHEKNCRWDAGKIKVAPLQILNLRNFKKEPIDPGSHRLFSCISLFTDNFLSLIKNCRVF